MEKIINDFAKAPPALSGHTYGPLQKFLTALTDAAVKNTNARYVLKRLEGKAVGDGKLVCKSVSICGTVTFTSATSGATTKKSAVNDAPALLHILASTSVPRAVLTMECWDVQKQPGVRDSKKWAILLRGTAKQPKRECLALIGKQWIQEILRTQQPLTPAIVLDIDDTLVDGDERVEDGFQQMADMVTCARLKGVSIHFVSARPESTAEDVLKLLHQARCAVDKRNLWLMNDKEYDSKNMKYVIRFKNKSYTDIRKQNRVIARFGDRLWDIARPVIVDRSLSTSELNDRSCFVTIDPTHLCLCAKMPGSSR